jgi:tetratricopeptide (TPR) repeat protein
MVTRPVVFISATSELQSARKLVGDVLYSMGYEPHWQDIQPTDGGEMLAVLRRWIEPSALVIQMVGQRYGAEPPAPTAEFGRVSYTQYEALYAEKAGKKVIYHFIEPDFPTDLTPAEPDTQKQLQAKYRERLVAANKLRHGNIASPTDLELSVRRLRDELHELRELADRRYHTLIEEIASMRSVLRDALAPKHLASAQNEPPPLPPELIEKAKLLLERGNAEDQALAKIALKQHLEADRIIQELKSKPCNPIDEAVALLTMEGDNWYQAGQPDRAIEPYEKAMVLRPQDVQVRNNVVIAHTQARRGNTTDHQRRAIQVAEGTLMLASPGSTDWAITYYNLGFACSSMSSIDLVLPKAIAAYEAALTVFTKDAHPVDWAKTQNNLGATWGEMDAGEGGENRRKAIVAYEAALTVFTNDAHAVDWAATQYNLGISWRSLSTGDRSENLRKAIAAYEAALTVRTRGDYGVEWANTHYGLALALADMAELSASDLLAYMARAIASGKAALAVYSAKVRLQDRAFLRDYRRTLKNLEIDRRAYEAAGGAKKQPFGDIEPAK